jgi:hypothetical protein
LSKAALLALASIPEGRYGEAEFKSLLHQKMGGKHAHLIPRPVNHVVEWTLDNRVAAAVEAVKAGAHVEEAARILGWRAFEALAEVVFRAWGYETIRNLHLGRREVDILARGGNITLVVECKRWRRAAGEATLAEVVEAVKGKAELLLKGMGPGHTTIPMVVTMQRYHPRLVDGVPIVPIGALQSFLQDLHQHIHSLRGWRRGTHQPSEGSNP